MSNAIRRIQPDSGDRSHRKMRIIIGQLSFLYVGERSAGRCRVSAGLAPSARNSLCRPFDSGGYLLPIAVDDGQQRYRISRKSKRENIIATVEIIYVNRKNRPRGRCTFPEHDNRPATSAAHQNSKNNRIPERRTHESACRAKFTVLADNDDRRF